MVRRSSKRSIVISVVLIAILFVSACGVKKNIDNQLQGDWTSFSDKYVAFVTFANGSYIYDNTDVVTGSHTYNGTYEIDTRNNIIVLHKPNGDVERTLDYSYDVDSGVLNVSWNGHDYIKLN